MEQLGEPSTGAELTEAQRALVDRFVDAFEAYDPDRLTELMHEDAALSMPPYELWLRGHESLREWFRTRGGGCHGSRLVPTRANGSPAFLQYRAAAGGGHEAWALVVLEVREDRIEEMANFLDVEAVFPLFGAPLLLPPTR